MSQEATQRIQSGHHELRQSAKNVSLSYLRPRFSICRTLELAFLHVLSLELERISMPYLRPIIRQQSHCKTWLQSRVQYDVKVNKEIQMVDSSVNLTAMWIK